MKTKAFLFLLLGSFLVHPALAQEAWKGEPRQNHFTIGALTGLAIINTSAGGAVLATASKKIVHDGFVPDINNQVFVELAMGPVFIEGVTALFYSTHLKWDFVKDPQWTFYAIGGLAGHVVDQGEVDQWGFHPRFGVGALMSASENVQLRGELSHELTAVGVSFGF